MPALCVLPHGRHGEREIVFVDVAAAMAERERLSEMTILPIVVVRCFERLGAKLEREYFLNGLYRCPEREIANTSRIESSRAKP
jgi:hypothetical protein